MKRIMILVLLFTLLVAAMPISAQDGLTAEQQTSVDVVSAALQALKSLDTYRLQGEQHISQQVTMGAAGSTSSEITQITDFQVQKIADGYDAAGTVQQIIAASAPGGAAGNISIPSTMLHLEIISVDGKTYMRVSFGDGTQATPNPMAAFLPGGWIDAGEGAGNPLLSALGPEALEGMYNQSLLIDATTIWSISEVAGEEMNGQGMRVFEIIYNPETYFQSEAFAGLSQAQSASGGGSGIPNIPNMPDLSNIPNMPEIPSIPNAPAPDAPPPQNIAMSMEVSLRAYVGGSDGLLHRMDTSVTYDTSAMQGTTVGGTTVPPVVMSVTGSTTFSEFNQPVTIEAPILGS